MSNPTRDDGGPAFPQTYRPDGYTSWSDGYGGISVRDYFAAQFLTTVTIIAKADPTDISRNCYVMADAMLEARKR